MPDTLATVGLLKGELAAFVAEREWESYHSPRNLVMALAVEAAELMEQFLWLGDQASRAVVQDPHRRPAIAEEIADVACYLLALANVMELELADAVLAKLAKNRLKYPAEEFRGHYERPVSGPADRPLGPSAG